MAKRGDSDEAKKISRQERQKELDRDTTGRTPGKPVAGSQEWADQNEAEGR